jgi:hypothetical protein
VGQSTSVAFQACNAPARTYIALSDPAEQQRIAAEIWQVLTSYPCWYLVGSSTNYQFYGQYQWRYRGFTDIYLGRVGVRSIGRYEDKNAAVVDLFDTRLIVIVNNHRFAFGSSAFVNYYEASDGVCV